MHRSATALVVVFLACHAFVTAANANVVTFSGLPDFDLNSVWVEDGIKVTGTGTGAEFGSFTVPDTLHLDGPSLYSGSVEFTMASLFDARSLDIIPMPTSGEYSARCDATACGLPFPNMLFEGFVGSDLVATMSMWMGTSAYTLSLPQPFSGLTSLRLSMLTAGGCMDSPCSHVNIDNVSLDPVPLPAALPLLASALTLLGAGGIRRRRRNAQHSAKSHAEV